MEKVSLRRDVQRLSAAQRNSSIDFHDVFGGPPRRSSMQDMHDAADDDDEANKWRSSWSCSRISEKPVFGDENVNQRRGYGDHYFFDDIFKGEKQHLDSPGSRNLSPIRALPPNVEPLSLPAQFSLPANLSKAVDHPTAILAVHSKYRTTNSLSKRSSHSSTPDISPPRFSSEAINCQEELIHDVRSYRPSPLSRGISINSEESINSDISDKGDKSKKDIDQENTKNSNQFHFSIYKWAGIGMPSVIPIRAGRNSRLKEKTKVERSSSFRSWIASKGSMDNVHNPNAFADTDTIAGYKNGNEVFNEGRSEHIVETQQTVQKSDPLISTKANMSSSGQGRGNDISKNHTSQYAGPREGSHNLPKKVAKKPDDGVPVEADKSRARSLHALFSKEERDTGSDRISSKFEGKEEKGKANRKSTIVNRKQKKQDEKGSTRINEQVNNSSLHGSAIRKGENEGVKKAKGKVKDFVKIFNHEASSSSTVDIDSRSQSNTWTNNTSKREKTGSVETNKTAYNMQVPDVNAKKMSTDASIKADEYLKESGKEHSARKTNDNVPNDTSAGQKDSSTSNTTSIPNRAKATKGDPEESYNGNFQVNEVLQADDELLKRDNNQEETQAIDAKIRKWRSGKEGNIRSLLSTLQYVLWPQSGWKPVPLVDIIEGNAVKKAYQKALLCLHPDKLQQKGASSHQKFIAEKVFDILQETWDHFNSSNTF